MTFIINDTKCQPLSTLYILNIQTLGPSIYIESAQFKICHKIQVIHD